MQLDKRLALVAVPRSRNVQRRPLAVFGMVVGRRVEPDVLRRLLCLGNRLYGALVVMVGTTVAAGCGGGSRGRFMSRLVRIGGNVWHARFLSFFSRPRPPTLLGPIQRRGFTLGVSTRFAISLCCTLLECTHLAS